jgi:hypothetical protein
MQQANAGVHGELVVSQRLLLPQRRLIIMRRRELFAALGGVVMARPNETQATIRKS